MGTLTLQKLKELWRCEQLQPGLITKESSKIVIRAKDIFQKLAELRKLVQNNATILNIDEQTHWGYAQPMGRDDNGRQGVINEYYAQCDNDENKKKLLDLIYNLCPGLNNGFDQNEAITSGKVYDDIEQYGITNPQSLPRTYFLSWNHPVSVANFLLNAHDINLNESWGWYQRNDTNQCNNRFPMK